MSAAGSGAAGSDAAGSDAAGSEAAETALRPAARASSAAAAARADAVQVAVNAAVKVSQRGPMSASGLEIAAMARVIETLLRDAFDAAFFERSRQRKREAGR